MRRVAFALGVVFLALIALASPWILRSFYGPQLADATQQVLIHVHDAREYAMSQQSTVTMQFAPSASSYDLRRDGRIIAAYTLPRGVRFASRATAFTFLPSGRVQASGEVCLTRFVLRRTIRLEEDGSTKLR